MNTLATPPHNEKEKENLMEFIRSLTGVVSVGNHRADVNTLTDLIWLSDCLNRFYILGDAMEKGSPQAIVVAAGEIKDACDINRPTIQRGDPISRTTFIAGAQNLLTYGLNLVDTITWQYRPERAMLS